MHETRARTQVETRAQGEEEAVAEIDTGTGAGRCLGETEKPQIHTGTGDQQPHRHSTLCR
jgi:hypothetical protein